MVINLTREVCACRRANAMELRPWAAITLLSAGIQVECRRTGAGCR
jgi:hypothetical protein